MSGLRVRELTPRGAGGVSVLEVAGEGALGRVLLLAPGARPPPLLKPVLLRLGREGEVLDEAIVLAHTEERVELHVHGSPALVSRLLRELAPATEPAPRATPAPRSLEERALALLSSAPCEAAARILLDQAQGALRSDVEAAARAGAPAPLLAALSERGRVARFALEPATVVLAGPVNAGKSTLFNLLVGGERVVVSSQAGTTRDAIRERALLGRWPVELVDSAGLRPLAATERVERAGQELARELALSAELVIWLDPADGAAATPPQVRGRLERLRSRVDAAAPRAHDEAGISALHAGPEAARRVAVLFRRALDLPEDPWLPGAGVPFAPDLRAALARAAEMTAAPRREALEALLADAR